jgi:predicted nucleotidyltransferase
MVHFDSNGLERLCKEHGVRRLRIFGSAARGEERPDSDVDLIVEFDRPTGFIELLRFERLLSDFFARPVDLVTEPGLDPFIRESVVMSAAVLFDAAA